VISTVLLKLNDFQGHRQCKSVNISKSVQDRDIVKNADH